MTSKASRSGFILWIQLPVLITGLDEPVPQEWLDESHRIVSAALSSSR